MPRLPVKLAAPLAALAALAMLASAGGAAPPDGTRAAGSAGVLLKRIGTFRSPTYVTAPAGDADRVFVVESAGRVLIVTGGRKLSRPFLDISSLVRSGGERGLLSIAFAPDYAVSGRLYAFFTDRRGDLRIEEFRRSASSPDAADRATRRVVLVQRHRRYPNHNGGQLAFGPDGLLYATTGDGGGGGDPLRSGQDRGSLLGKVLRIDPAPAGGRAYTIPADNPFRGRSGARGEVYAYGLRNPFRLSFDRQTGDIAIADVGQDRVEEVDFARAGGARGANYGWSRFEGRTRFRSGSVPGHVPPVLERSHRSGWCAIIGGYVVRDPALPGLDGRYVYGDYCRSGLRSVVLRKGRARGDSSLGVSVPELSSFGEDGTGRVYATSLRGAVYRLVPR